MLRRRAASSFIIMPDTSPNMAAMLLVIWGPNPVFKVEPLAPEVPIDPGQFNKIMALSRHHLVRRLLLAMHYTCCRNGKLEFVVGEQELSRLAWGGQRPKHWRSVLTATIDRAIAECKSWSPESTMVINYNEANHSYAIRVPPSFLGSLKALVQKNQLRLRKRNPDPDKRISKKQLAVLRDHGWEEDGDGKSGTRLRELVRYYCNEAATVPTLRTIARSRNNTGGYRTIFIPALLGEDHVCRELGPLVNLLADNCTRWKSGVTDAKIAASANGADRIICSFLDPMKSYATFAGNNGARGYRAAVWAKMLHTDAKTFLKRLAAARDRLGLIVVGVDRENQFYDLDALAAGTAALWDRAAVRIYSEKDYRRRWAAVLSRTAE